MTWSELESNDKDKLAKAQQEKLATIAQAYHHTFTTDMGKKVLDHLMQNYVMGNDTPLDAKNVTYEAGYHAGEAGIVKMILNQLQRAKTL